MTQQTIQGRRVGSRYYDPDELHSEVLVKKIVTLRKRKLPYRAIAEKLRIGVCTVQGVCQRQGLAHIESHRPMPKTLSGAIEEALDRYGTVYFDRSWVSDAEDGVIAFVGDRPGRAERSVRAALQSAVDARGDAS